MTDHPSPPTARSPRRSPTGLSLAVLLALTTGALAIGLFASASVLRVSSLAAQAEEARRPERLALREPAPPIPGFQRRGASFVGDVRTSDGALVRLVFDAKSQALIGLKVVEPAGAVIETANAECALRPAPGR